MVEIVSLLPISCNDKTFSVIVTFESALAIEMTRIRANRNGHRLDIDSCSSYRICPSTSLKRICILYSSLLSLSSLSLLYSLRADIEASLLIPNGNMPLEETIRRDYGRDWMSPFQSMEMGSREGKKRERVGGEGRKSGRGGGEGESLGVTEDGGEKATRIKNREGKLVLRQRMRDKDNTIEGSSFS